MGLGHSPRIVTDGLLVCLDPANKKSYGGSGATWTDLSGRGNDFTLSGVTFTENGGASYFEFGDNEGDYAYKSSTDIMVGLTEYTIDMWILLTTLQSQIAFVSYASSANNNDFLIFKNGGDLTMPFPNAVSVADSFYNVGNWINLVGTRNVTDGKFYFDGVHTHSYNAGSGSASGSGGTLVIGQEQDSVGGGFATSQDMPGYLGLFKIYNRALTADEIRQNYLATKERYA